MGKSGKGEAAFLKAKVPVLVHEEDGQFVAYCPPLDISTYAETEEELMKAFHDAFEIHLEYLLERGTLEEELIRLGWTLSKSSYQPPARTIKPSKATKKLVERVEFPRIGGERRKRYRA